MKLTELLKNVTPLTIVGDAEVDITGVNIDSRKVENGHLNALFPKPLSWERRLCWVKICPTLTQLGTVV